MRYIAALTLSMLIPVSAFAYSPKQPEPHKRFSPNSKYFVDFNPETNHHTVYAAASPDDPLWSIDSNAFWPYKHDESDGCLFVADDGSSITGPTWVHWTGRPPDYRVFDGLEFWNANGRVAAYRFSELPSWRLKVLDFPSRLVWIAIHGPERRGRNLTRHENELHATTFGMRSFTFSLQNGEILGWDLNANYFAYLAIVYAIPVWLAVRWIVRRWRGCRASTTGQNYRRGVVVNNLGSALVVLNSLGFAFGVFLDSFGGTIDQIGAHFCRLTYPIAFILIPVTLVISAAGLASRPRHFDMLGPWLAIMSAVVLVAILNPEEALPVDGPGTHGGMEGFPRRRGGIDGLRGVHGFEQLLGLCSLGSPACGAVESHVMPEIKFSVGCRAPCRCSSSSRTFCWPGNW